MSRLFAFLTLSLALHLFAVFPLLAEQFAGGVQLAGGVPEPTLLAVPNLVMRPAAVLPAAQASVAPVAEPVLVKPAAAAVRLHETRAALKAKTVLKPESVPQVREKPVLETQAAAASQKVAVDEDALQSSEPIHSAQSLSEAAAVLEAVPEPEVSAPGDGPAVAEGVAPVAAQSTRSTPSTQEVISSKPRFARAPSAPVYPALARRRQQQGTVWLEVRLDARGKQVELQVLRSSTVPSLDQAALAAVRKWQFLPETYNGVGVPSRVQIPIEFAIAAKP